MAEKIEIAALDIDASLLIQSTTEVGKQITDLRAKMKSLRDEGKQNTVEYTVLGAQVKNLSKDYNQLNGVVQTRITTDGKLLSVELAMEKALKSQNVTTKGAVDNNKELRQIRQNLDATTVSGAAAIAKLNAKINENSQFIKENGDANEQRIAGIGQYKEQILQAYAEIQKEKAALQALNKELIESKETLDENSDAWKVINVQINQNNIQINNLNDQMAKSKGEFTDFSDVLSLANGGLSGFKERAEAAGGTGPLLGNAFKAMTTGLWGMVKAGLAFIATPIGLALTAIAVVIALVVGAFKFMVASMNSTEEGSNKLAKAMAYVTGLLNGFWKIIKPLGEFLGKVFIAYLEAVGMALDELSEGIAKALDFLGFTEAAADLRGFKEELKQSAIAAADLAAAEAELQKMQREGRKIQLDYQKQAEKLRQLRDDESKSMGERVKANEQLGAVLKEQAAAELAIANQALRVADLRIKSEGETTEALDKRAEALTNIADIQERITGQESEQLANLNSLRKEAFDKEKERQQGIRDARQKTLDDLIEKLGLEKEIYAQATEGRLLTYEQEFAKADELYKRQLEIIQSQKAANDAAAQNDYAASKKTGADKLALQRRLNLNELELTASKNEALIALEATKREAIIAEADLELEHQKTLAKTRLDANKFLTDELVQQEKDRLDALNQLEVDNLALKYNNGLIAEREYLDAVNELYAANDKTQAELDTQRRQAEQDQQLLDLENQKSQKASEFEENMKIEQLQADIKREQEIANAKKTGADVSLIEDKFAKDREDREKAVQTYKMDLRAQALGNLSTIFGQETTAGKLFAAAQATIDTYVAANKALAAYPPPFGAIAAAAAIATGIGNVKKITSTKTKFERGGLQEVGGNRHSAGGTKFTGSDGTQFEAEQGELIGVMNRNAAKHFMAFNNAFPAGAGSAPNYFASGGFVNRTEAQGVNFDIDELAMKIAAANASMPAPIVAVSDIAAVTGNLAKVQQNANF